MADNEMKGGVEPYTPLTPGAVLGGRRRKSLKLVTKKKARKVLKKLGMKLRGGNEPEDTASVPVPKEDIKAADKIETGSTSTSSSSSTEGGRRRRKGTKKTHRGGRKGKGKRRSLFGMRY